jgi:hypothetical protein
MYYIINRTTNQTTTHYGNFPDVDDLLNRGDDIIIISLYSNTIKTPYKEYDGEWGWKDYDAPFLSYTANDPKDITDDYAEMSIMNHNDMMMHMEQYHDEINQEYRRENEPEHE